MTEQPICCTVHPDAAAGWQCTNQPCRQHLCSKCTARLIKLFTCCTCGGHARQLTVSRKSKSRAYWLAAALRYPFGAGLPLAAAMAIVLAAVAVVAGVVEAQAHQLDGVVRAVRVSLIVVYVLVTIDRTARGAETGKLLRFARTVVATALLWLPSVGYVALLGAPGPAAQHDWVLWLFAVLAVIYVPLAVAVAVTDISFFVIANPFRMFDYMFRLGKTYVITLVAMLLLAALSILGAGVAGAIQQAIPTPIVGAAAAQLPMLAGLAMLGHVVGMLAHVHGDLIGWGSVDLFVDPVFPHMVAEGRRKIASRPDVEPSGAATSTAPDALASPRERAEAAKLISALKAEELGRALRIYESRPTWSATTIDDRQLIILAKAGARAGKLALAQRLLETACARNGRSVGQAWLALAQLHADALGQTARAREIYSKIVEGFPGSDVAKLAAVQIGHASQGITA